MNPRAWSEPGVETVAPGVHRIPLPMPEDGLTAVNVYALEDGDRITLVDGGWAVAPARAELERAMRAIGADLRAIRRVLVTHAHRDHFTLAVVLRRELGVEISLGAGERPAIEALTSRTRHFGAQVALLREAGAEALARRVEEGDSKVDPIPEGWEAPDRWLEPGVLEVGGRALDVIPTPGHTQGHVVFASREEGLLFAGDHVLPHITPSIGFEPVPAASPLRDFLASLERIRALPDLRLLPAHGAAGSSSHARVSELVDHHDTRLAEMVAAARRLGGGTAFEIAQNLGWTRHKRRFSELDTFNQMLAVTETVAHLRLLADTGALGATRDRDGVVSYAAVAP